MSVIVELTLPAEEFELGTILEMEGDADIVLETLVPLGERSIPFFRHRGGRNAFETVVRGHPDVDGIHVVNTDGDETVYALDWEVSEDAFFEGVVSTGGTILEASGTVEEWSFELRFLSHESLSAFQAYCTENDIQIEVERIYNPTNPDAGPWYGLTAPQRETLARAVETGYYAIPRGYSTQDLADEFGLSDQAVTERLRRAISTLVTNTLLRSEQEGPGDD